MILLLFAEIINDIPTIVRDLVYANVDPDDLELKGGDELDLSVFGIELRKGIDGVEHKCIVG